MRATRCLRVFVEGRPGHVPLFQSPHASGREPAAMGATVSSATCWAWPARRGGPGHERRRPLPAPKPTRIHPLSRSQPASRNEIVGHSPPAPALSRPVRRRRRQRSGLRNAAHAAPCRTGFLRAVAKGNSNARVMPDSSPDIATTDPRCERGKKGAAGRSVCANISCVMRSADKGPAGTAAAQIPRKAAVTLLDVVSAATPVLGRGSGAWTGTNTLPPSYALPPPASLVPCFMSSPTVVLFLIGHS